MAKGFGLDPFKDVIHWPHRHVLAAYLWLEGEEWDRPKATHYYLARLALELQLLPRRMRGKGGGGGRLEELLIKFTRRRAAPVDPAQRAEFDTDTAKAKWLPAMGMAVKVYSASELAEPLRPGEFPGKGLVVGPRPKRVGYRPNVRPAGD